MGIQRRGNLSSSRNPDLEPRIAVELAKLRKSIAAITFGTQLPPFPAVGDKHYYQGTDTDEFKADNWYIAGPDGSWRAASADQVEASSLRGTIPAGVIVTGYLPLTGGIMGGAITFHEDQEIPGNQITGAIPTGVTIEDYIPKSGGQLFGNLDFTNKNLTRVRKITGLDTSLYIDMNTDGEISVVADVEINLTAPNVYISAALDVGGGLAVTGDISAANFQDVGVGDAPVLSAENFTDYNIVVTDDSVVVHQGGVIYV